MFWSYLKLSKSMGNMAKIYRRQVQTSKCICTDTDECAEGTHNCHGVAHCYNNEASFTCQCRSGYAGDGLTCSPLGELLNILIFANTF